MSEELATAMAGRVRPSPSYSFTVRVSLPQRGGEFARVAHVIAEERAMLGAIDLVRTDGDDVVRDVTVLCVNSEHSAAVVAAIRSLPGVHVDSVSDRTFLAHKGGKLEIRGKLPLKTRDDLSMVYTPGVGRVSMAIHEDPESAWALTVKGNTVAVVTDGTAVLGLGDIGPAAAMPVMEGKAVLFKELAGVDAFPLCLDTKDVGQIVDCVKAIAPTFGGINLEDISAPRCFEIERRLRSELNIPVFHDDQHGTAMVLLAALLNALRVVGKHPADIRVVVVGAGAAGIASTEILLAEGITDIVLCDRDGALYPGAECIDGEMARLAERTNPRALRGGPDEVLAGADVLIGVSGRGAVSYEGVRSMASEAIVFALANPVPEIRPEEVPDNVAVMATGRADYPNQINNVLAFPGVFKGALKVRAQTINEHMKLAGAHAIAEIVAPEELHPEYIVPSVFNRRVAESVAAAVAGAAIASGATRHGH